MSDEDVLRIQPATLDDARELFEWRNDPEARSHFLKPDAVTWEEHVAWLSRTLNGEVPGRILCIALGGDGKKIGMIRGDDTKDGVELSYTIAPHARGKGYGKHIALQFVKKYFPDKPLIARVQKGHIPSERVAQALKLSPYEEEIDSTGRTFVTWR